MFSGIGMQEMVIIGIVAVLLFGKRLPEVAKSVGGSYREFKKGLTEIQSSFTEETSSKHSTPTTTATPYGDYDDFDDASAPKFEPPPSEPHVESKPESTANAE